MADQKNLTPDSRLQDQMSDLFSLMDEKAAKGELIETDEVLTPSKFRGGVRVDVPEEQQEQAPMNKSETAAYEYSMMMSQFEAMMEDWNRREAEERAEREAAAAAKAEQGE